MHFVILTQYYPPETGAPQNRLSDLAQRLKHLGHDVTILTAMPNYPQNEIFDEYKSNFFKEEELSGIRILRSWIFVGKSRSVFFRLMNYFSFTITSFIYGVIKLGKHDFIICESPPLFLGITGYLLAKIKKARFVFNVSDLWPESAEKLGVITNKKLLKVAEKLEMWLYRKSDLITGQTQGIVKNIESRITGKKVHWLPNGLSPEILNYNFDEGKWRKENNFSSSDFILNYVGIIGHAQGLEIIINAANNLKENKNIKFVIAGNGPELNKLMEMQEKLDLENVFFTGAVTKMKALEIVYNSDAAIIPLKKLELFKGAIPSKIFENASFRKPIILGVDGEAKQLFIDEGRTGLHFEPENITQLTEAISKLSRDKGLCADLGENGRNFVVKNFSRDAIAKQFLEALPK